MQNMHYNGVTCLIIFLNKLKLHYLVFDRYLSKVAVKVSDMKLCIILYKKTISTCVCNLKYTVYKR